MSSDDLLEYGEKNDVPKASETMVKVNSEERIPLLLFENVGSATADPFDMLWGTYINPETQEKEDSPAFAILKRFEKAHWGGTLKKMIGGESRMRETYRVVDAKKRTDDSDDNVIYSIFPYKHKRFDAIYWVIARGTRDYDHLRYAGVNPDEEGGDWDDETDEPVLKLTPVMCDNKLNDVNSAGVSGEGYAGLCGDPKKTKVDTIVMRTDGMEVWPGGDPVLGAILHAIWTWTHPPTDEEYEEAMQMQSSSAEAGFAVPMALGPLIALLCD